MIIVKSSNSRSKYFTGSH